MNMINLLYYFENKRDSSNSFMFKYGDTVVGDELWRGKGQSRTKNVPSILTSRKVALFSGNIDLAIA